MAHETGRCPVSQPDYGAQLSAAGCGRRTAAPAPGPHPAAAAGRITVGMAEMPLGAAVETEMTVHCRTDPNRPGQSAAGAVHGAQLSIMLMAPDL